MPEKDLYHTVQLFSADEMRWLRVLRESQREKTQLMNPIWYSVWIYLLISLQGIG